MKDHWAMKGIAAIAVLIPLITHVSAAERQALPGFQKFQFGMSEQQIRRITKIEQASTEKEGLWLTSVQSVEIDGINYRLRFLLTGGKLYRIRLSDETVASDGACETHFGRVFGLVKAKYGNPDEPPEREVFPGGLATIRTAKFTFRDGGQIISSTYYQDGKCTVLISYTGAMGSGSF
jgi:hypothetical protein